jgi:hypothetical protein
MISINYKDIIVEKLKELPDFDTSLVPRINDKDLLNIVPYFHEVKKQTKLFNEKLLPYNLSYVVLLNINLVEDWTTFSPADSDHGEQDILDITYEDEVIVLTGGKIWGGVSSYFRPVLSKVISDMSSLDDKPFPFEKEGCFNIHNSDS